MLSALVTVKIMLEVKVLVTARELTDKGLGVGDPWPVCLGAISKIQIPVHHLLRSQQPLSKTKLEFST